MKSIFAYGIDESLSLQLLQAFAAKGEVEASNVN